MGVSSGGSNGMRDINVFACAIQAPVIYARPSDEDSWDHITAIELSNFNVQYGYDKNMPDLPRATQSLIRNGWIEHTEFPGDLSNGQWEIEALSLENNTNALICHHARLVSTQLYNFIARLSQA